MKQPFYNIIIIITLSSIFMGACSPKQLERKTILDLEQKIDAISEKTTAHQKIISDSLLKPLMQAYASYVQKYKKDDDKMVPIYLYRMGSLYYQIQNWKAAIQHFEYVIDGYKSSDAYPEAIILAATLQEERMNNSKRAGVLYQTYLDKFPNGPHQKKAAFFFKSPEEKTQARIADLQNQIREDNKSKGGNRRLSHILVRQYTTYAKTYPNNNFTPMYCFEGGKLASNLGETANAIELWLNIYDQYHDFHLYPETLLLLAVEYENKMPIFLQRFRKQKKFKQQLNARFVGKDWTEIDWTKEAQKLYKEFLSKYPNHELASHAEASLKYIGKNPTDVVKEFRVNLDSLRQGKNH